ncbi:nicotinate mononucleotide-dependent phosphoribosyltransferase CobT [Halomicronema sp. CCY15110]|uniref:nicotinate mononucleotide-dependent phosphoribosyltransferase CobT n=1 Tax=Halomicronema sp. CCY15110 TaxID=2767773 RepID=UPI00194FD4F9|nr:TIGR00303 family protein [Halomicronema sp. CCY15110]
MNRIYTQTPQGQRWLRRYRGHRPRLACVLGFTETGLIPGISAAGATPDDRRFTAIADAEFLWQGLKAPAQYPLPPLLEGVSPVLIARAIVAAQLIPVMIFDAGLPVAPSVPHIELPGQPAACVSSGQALPLAVVERLFRQGLAWGHHLGNQVDSDYVILGECVVGGTTTALAVLLGLGLPITDKMGSSHVTCNHAQKQAIANQGLARWRAAIATDATAVSPLALVAAVGDPMQVVVAAMAIGASCHGGVMLAGGTQMLAVYALARSLARAYRLSWQPERVVVGTTRWVAEDPTCDTVGVAELVGDVPLIATELSFATSRYEALRRYEAGFVKEGVAAGGCAIAAHLYQHWQQPQLLHIIESQYEQLQQQQQPAPVPS